MRSCPDGYPSCRKAEAEGEWCKGECEALRDQNIPTETGLYWYRLRGSKAWRPQEVFIVNGVLGINNGEGFLPVTKPDREWSGPLPRPPK